MCLVYLLVLPSHKTYAILSSTDASIFQIIGLENNKADETFCANFVVAEQPAGTRTLFCVGKQLKPMDHDLLG
jgi:hypothetical protein